MINPVIGSIERDEISIAFDSPFGNFKSEGVHGLAVVNGKRLYLLVVVSYRKREGVLRKFIAECKSHYEAIGVWDIGSQILFDALKRYGFIESRREFISGDPVDGLEWSREIAATEPQASYIPDDMVVP